MSVRGLAAKEETPEARLKRGQITVASAREKRRCRCNLGVSCSGSGAFACGTGGDVAFDTGFCDHCRRLCGAGR